MTAAEGQTDVSKVSVCARGQRFRGTPAGYDYTHRRQPEEATHWSGRPHGAVSAARRGQDRRT